MKFLITTLLFFSFINLFAQNNFFEGYYIDNRNEKIKGYILNENFIKLPDYIEFKKNEKSVVEKISTKKIKAFEIDKKIKFIKKNVSLQQSSNKTNELTNYRNPDLKTENVFLKVLVEGKANLYMNNDQDKIKFFLQVDEDSIIPLIYKRYYIKNNQIAENNQYKQDLMFRVSCESLSDKDFNLTNYNQKGLSKLVQKYNTCKNANQFIYEKPKYFSFNLGLRLGILNQKFEITNTVRDEFSSDFGSSLNYRFGFELEFSIQSLKFKRWSIYIDPSFSTYQSSAMVNNGDQREITLNTLQVPFGIRYYINTSSSNHKFFVNAFLATNTPIGENDIRNVNLMRVKINSPHSYLGAGIGYRFKERLSIEIRTDTSQDFLDELFGYNSKFQSNFAFVFGYNLL